MHRGKFNILAVILLAFLLCINSLATEETVPAEEQNVLVYAENVRAAAVYNIENGQTVFAHNENEMLPTASFTKMMTALVAYEILAERTEETLTVEYSMIKDASGNQVGYYVGETVSVTDMFGGLLVRGANDSAYLLAHIAAGSVDSFITLMNEKAAALGMTSTVYKNPTGMSADGMVTTAADSVLLARAFYENDFLTSLSTAVKYEMPATERSGVRTIYNRNGLVSKVVEKGYFDPRITGLNSGSTTEAGYYTASAVDGEELSYIIVALGGEQIEERNAAYLFTSELATYAQKEYGYVEVIRAGGIVCEVPVELSTDADYVTLVPGEGLTMYLPTSVTRADLTYEYRLDSETLKAPVTEGQSAGSYSVYLDGEYLGSVPLITQNSLSRSEFLVALDRIERFTTSTFFIVTVISAVVLTVLYFVVSAYIRTHRHRRGHYRAHRRKIR
ncbi:MAG: D-alanyl-D-alanine carboxypeptidase [Clostridia bacterium]|nr:D-alanyl-D-alanine carboxypeptidase [Clostridia bacterium]